MEMDRDDPQASSAIATGAPIRVVGLAKAAQYNGSIGVVVQGGSERVGVRLADSKKELSVKHSNLALIYPRRVLALAGQSTKQGEIEAWDADTMVPLRTLRGHAGPAILALSHDGSRVVSGSGFPDCGIKAWQVETGTVVFDKKGHTVRSGCTCQPVFGVLRTDPHCPVEGHEATISGLGFTRDDAKLVSVSHDRHVKIWDSLSGQLLNRQKPLRHSSWIFSLAMSMSDARVCASGGEDGIRLWDLDLCVGTRHICGEDCGGGIRLLSFCAGGNLLAAFNTNSDTPDIWTLDGTKHSTMAPATPDNVREATALACSHTENWIAAGFESGHVVIWNLTTSSIARTTHTPHPVSALSFHPDGESVLWCSVNGRMWRWDRHSDTLQSGGRSKLRGVRGLSVRAVGMPLSSTLAMAMGLHARVGSASPLRVLHSDELQRIVDAFPGTTAAEVVQRCEVSASRDAVSARRQAEMEVEGEKFLLQYGPFRFRRTDVGTLVPALRQWWRATIGSEAPDKTVEEWVAAKRNRYCEQVAEGGLDHRKLMQWAFDGGCGLSVREQRMAESLATSEVYTRGVAAGQTSQFDATFDDVFGVCLLGLLDATAADPMLDPVHDLMGGEDPDCFVVETMREYARLERQPQSVWPSDVLVKRVEIVGQTAQGDDSSFAVVASFPGEIRLVVDWQRHRASLDCVVIDADAQASICSQRDLLAMAQTLMCCSQLRFGFRLDDVVSTQEESVAYTDSPLRGHRNEQLGLGTPVTCTRRRLHSADNVSGRPCQPCTLPPELHGATSCSVTLQIPKECGEQGEGFARNQMVVERLMQVISGEGEEGGAAEASPDEDEERDDDHDHDDDDDDDDDHDDDDDVAPVLGGGAFQHSREVANRMISAERMFVKVHPHDSRSGVPTFVLLETPRSFVPRVNPESGMAENWGFNDGSWEPNPMRVFEVQSLYSFGDPTWSQLGTPELQFTRALVGRKRSALAQQLEARESLMGCDFVLRAALVRRPRDTEEHGALKELTPSVWRRVSVCGGLTLRTLHDRVLGPAFGWTRNYHGYYFVDPTDGAVFAPQSGALDMMHSRFHYAESMPDDCRLAQLVCGPGDRLLYTYDLGDQWTHLLTVEAVGGAEQSTGRSAVLGGAMACPPEDSMGFDGMGPSSYEREVLQRSGRLSASMQREIARANNVAGSSFDPHAFDLAAAETRVREACAGRASVRGGELSYSTTLLGAESADPASRLPTGRGITVARSGDGMAGAQSVRVPERRDPRAERVCGACGSPHSLKLCSGCKATAYCSPSCQKQDWKAHKAQCRAIAAKKNPLSQ